jgi:hypothetical protein
MDSVVAVVAELVFAELVQGSAVVLSGLVVAGQHSDVVEVPDLGNVPAVESPSDDS